MVYRRGQENRVRASAVKKFRTKGLKSLEEEWDMNKTSHLCSHGYKMLAE